jgi:hypothetical protein
MKWWISVGLVVVALAVETAASAETTLKKDPERISLDFSSTPVSTALNVLFAGKGLNFVIQPDVTGTVNNLHLMDVPFEVALKSLMKSVDPPLVYKKDGDVYVISVKKPEPAPSDIEGMGGTPQVIESPVTSQDMIIEKITLNFLDAYVVKDLIEGKITQPNNNQNGFGGLGVGNGFGNSSFGGGFGTLGGGFMNNSSGGYGVGYSGGYGGGTMGNWGGNGYNRGF